MITEKQSSSGFQCLVVVVTDVSEPDRGHCRTPLAPRMSLSVQYLSDAGVHVLFCAVLWISTLRSCESRSVLDVGLVASFCRSRCTGKKSGRTGSVTPGNVHNYWNISVFIESNSVLKCVLQAQFSFIGSSLHHRTPYVLRVPRDSSVRMIFWFINATLLFVPQLFAYRCVQYPAFFSPVKLDRRKSSIRLADSTLYNQRGKTE